MFLSKSLGYKDTYSTLNVHDLATLIATYVFGPQFETSEKVKQTLGAMCSQSKHLNIFKYIVMLNVLSQ